MGIVDLVVVIVAAEGMDTVEADIVVAATVAEEEVTVEVVIVEEEITVSVMIVIIIKILDTNLQENQDHMAIHLRTLNADMRKKHCMLQRQNTNSTRNASLYFLQVVEKNTLRAKELDIHN